MTLLETGDSCFPLDLTCPQTNSAQQKLFTWLATSELIVSEVAGHVESCPRALLFRYFWNLNTIHLFVVFNFSFHYKSMWIRPQLQRSSWGEPGWLWKVLFRSANKRSRPGFNHARMTHGFVRLVESLLRKGFLKRLLLLSASNRVNYPVRTEQHPSISLQPEKTSPHVDNKYHHPVCKAKIFEAKPDPFWRVRVTRGTKSQPWDWFSV